MAFIVLFSTLSFTVNYHYCGDKLVDSSFFASADTCGMDMDAYPYMANDSYCNDKSIAFEGQDELKLSFNKLALDQQVFLASFYLTYIDLFEGLDKNVVPHQAYPPPLLVKDISLLDQVFII